ncbi:MAG: DUF3221 domain-containing protein [Culicoidibacterales bacterium]
MKHKYLWIFIIIAMVLAIVSVQRTVEIDEIEIRGTITQLQASEDGAVILVETPSGDEVAAYDKAAVRLTQQTPIMLDSQRLQLKQLEVGMYVAIQFEGPVAESYPVQAVAREVEVIQTDQLK